MIPFHLAPAPIVAGIVLLALWRWNRNSWAAGLATGCGFGAGFVAVAGFTFAPAAASDWLLYIAVAATAVGLLELAPRWVQWIAQALVAVGTVWLILGRVAEPPWESPLSRFAWTSGLGAALLVWSAALGARPEATRGFVLPAALTITAAGASFLLLQDGNAKLAELAAALSMALGVVAAIAWRYRELKLAPSGTGVAATTLGALLLCGWLFGDALPVWSLLAILAAPLPALLRTRRWWVPLALAALLAGAAVLIVHLGAEALPAEDYGYGYD